MAETAELMPGAPVARSPLAHRAPAFTPDGAASLAEWPFLAKAIVRADPAEAGPRLADALSLPLPTTPCASATAEGRTALWLGPDEWMAIAPDAAAADLAGALEAALEGLPHQVVDVSDHYTTITLSGRRSRDILARLVTVDLHPRAFPAGRVVGTLAGHAAVFVWLRDDSPAAGGIFDVVVRASFADYLWCLLAEAGRTFGLPPAEPVAGEPMRP